MIEAELKSLLPLYEEKHYACGLQLVGGRIEVVELGPRCLQGPGRQREGGNGAEER